MPVHAQEFHDAHTGLSDHAEMLAEAARLLPTVPAGERAPLLERVTAFLGDEVVPHTKLDERVLFPEVSSRLGDSLATATMNYDHVAIRGLIDDLAAADPDDVNEVQELLYGLHALIRMHIWKEERLYLAMLDRVAWPAH
jgi:iron-sulfur cluster repair protein YtfE (RIC family)